MLKNPKVAATIEAGKQARAERTAVTQDWVVERLRENVERAMQHSPVLDSLGRETGEYTYQGGVANQALALLAKHTGVFSDKVEHGVTPGQRRVKFIMELASDD
jgi:microcompartment protein CcmL/EutN